MSYKPKDHTIPKCCKTCGVVKNPEEFYATNRQKYKHLGAYRSAHCIPCHNKKHSDRKKAMGEEWHKIENARKKRWIDNNLEKSISTSKNGRLKRQFGITLEQYNKLLESQSGECAICHTRETKLTRLNKPKDLAVDHCHSTGKVRGLLCFHCNSSLGKLKDSIDLLQNAINYLKKSRDEL